MKVIYQDPSHAVSFCGIFALHRVVKSRKSRNEILQWLNGFDVAQTDTEEVPNESNNRAFHLSAAADRCYRFWAI